EALAFSVTSSVAGVTLRASLSSSTTVTSTAVFCLTDGDADATVTVIASSEKSGSCLPVTITMAGVSQLDVSNRTEPPATVSLSSSEEVQVTSTAPAGGPDSVTWKVCTVPSVTVSVAGDATTSTAPG